MLRATMKSLLSRKLRLVLSGLAVILGVMFVSGAFVLTDTLGRSFTSLFATAFANTDVQVAAKAKVAAGDAASDQGIASLPAGLVQQVKAVPGVVGATGEVRVNGARLIGKNGKVVGTFGAPQFGINWTDTGTATMRPGGRAPQADDEIAINGGLAKSAGVAVGDRVGVLTLAPKQTFTIVGIFGFSGDRDSLGGEQTVAFDHADGADGSCSARHRVLVDRRARRAGRRRRHPARTGSPPPSAPTTRWRPASSSPTDNAASIQKGLSFFNYILLGFAGVALFVGTFLILNTFSIIVAQRTRELALMRAIGASRRQMIGSVLLEATVIGLIASVVGLAAGIGVGALLAYAVRQRRRQRAAPGRHRRTAIRRHRFVRGRPGHHAGRGAACRRCVPPASRRSRRCARRRPPTGR